jgi:hypothetical protein
MPSVVGTPAPPAAAAALLRSPLPSWREVLRETLPLGATALAVTLARLAGERLGWSERWFSRATGGVVPSGVGWVVGITWLALPFGIWLAARLVARGRPPASARSAIGFALLGAIVLVAGLRIVPRIGLGMAGFLLAVWTTAVVAAAVAWRGWPALGRELVAYGLLSRAPVAIIMLLAMQGRWGTHYDYADAPRVQQMPFWTAYAALALAPQLVFWVAFTVAAGMVTGSLAAAALGRKKG